MKNKEHMATNTTQPSGHAVPDPRQKHILLHKQSAASIISASCGHNRLTDSRWHCVASLS